MYSRIKLIFIKEDRRIMADIKPFFRLDSANSTVIFDCQSKTPALLYFGKRLSEQTTETMLTQLATRQEVKCAVVEEAPISLSPLLGEGSVS